MQQIDYVTDRKGHPKAIVIPITLWRQILPGDVRTVDELIEALEDYCLNKAMDEAKDSPLLTREEALAYLES